MRGTGRLLAVAVVLALGAGACTSDDAPPASGPSTTEAEATSTTTAPPGGVTPDPSKGCGTKPDVAAVSDDPPGDVEQTITIGDTERTYRLAVPVGYDADEPTPLVVNLHGSGSSADQQVTYSDAARVGSDRGFLVVSPDAIDGRWELSGTGADAELLDQLVDDVAGRYCVDRNRVHIMGLSLGAWKSAVTACASGDRYASAALVTVEVFPGECPPMPVVAFHGTGDLTVPYGEGADEGAVVTGPNRGLPGARDNIAQWAESGGCHPEPEITAVGDDVELWRFPGCDEGVGVELYTIKGGGHTWPGSAVNLGPPEWTTQTIDATDLAFDWFEAHPNVRR